MQVVRLRHGIRPVRGVYPCCFFLYSAQRTHENGIRMALGARAVDVLKLVVSRSMAWVMAGIGVGVAVSIGLARLLGDVLYDVRPMHPKRVKQVDLPQQVLCAGLQRVWRFFGPLRLQGE